MTDQTGGVRYVTNSKNMTRLIVLLLALGLIGACDIRHQVGGPCDYASFEGMAEVIDLEKNTTGQVQTYHLRFTLLEPVVAKERSSHLPWSEKLNGWVFYKETNDSVLSGAQVGERFYTRAELMTRGTCTPASFDVIALAVPKMTSIYFAYDSKALNAAAKVTLDQYLRAYRQHHQHGEVPRFTLEGNTDQKGSREYNIELGTGMAEAVKDYLLRGGVQASDVETVSFGEEHPQCMSSMDESCQAQNRHVDVYFD